MLVHTELKAHLILLLDSLYASVDNPGLIRAVLADCVNVCADSIT